MEKYLGVKVIQAEPAVRTEGGLSNDGYTVIYEDGYRSWSPKNVFEKAYKEVGNYNSLILDANTITGEWNVYNSGDCCDDSCDNTCESIN